MSPCSEPASVTTTAPERSPSSSVSKSAVLASAPPTMGKRLRLPLVIAGRTLYSWVGEPALASVAASNAKASCANMLRFIVTSGGKPRRSRRFLAHVGGDGASLPEERWTVFFLHTNWYDSHVWPPRQFRAHSMRSRLLQCGSSSPIITRPVELSNSAWTERHWWRFLPRS